LFQLSSLLPFSLPTCSELFLPGPRSSLPLPSAVLSTSLLVSTSSSSGSPTRYDRSQFAAPDETR
jgi:hypothetical protein